MSTSLKYSFLVSISLLISCQNQPNNRLECVATEVTKEDSATIIQKVLDHKQLDLLLNFAFKNKTLKIVKNNIVRTPLNLVMNSKPVEFTEIDSSSSKLRIWNRPTFFAKITVMKITSTEAKLVIFFESIGLFGEYWLKKGQDVEWRVSKVNFAHT